jgi:hypothetical protein
MLPQRRPERRVTANAGAAHRATAPFRAPSLNASVRQIAFTFIAGASTLVAAMFGVTIVLSVACGSPGQPPSSIGADFSGVWSGQFRFTQCSGDRNCIFFIREPQSFFLRLTQAASYVTGILGSDDLTVDLSGTVGPSGDLTLTRWRPAASAFDVSGEVQVTRFVLRPSPTTGLAGTLEYQLRFTSDQNRETNLIVRDADIVSATRGAPQTLTSSFQGHWKGRYVARGCTVVGWPSCTGVDPDRTYIFDLSLTQVGTTVSGMFTVPQNVSRTIPVTGTVTKDVLILDGSARREVSGAFEINRVTSWTVTDGFGRLRGSFRYVIEVHWTFGELAGQVYTMTVDGALVSAVLVP